jgi:hypothetical protein
MEQADEISAMVPYLFYELMDSLGGVIDLDADRVLELIKSEQKRGLAVSISNGKLRVEILEKDEMDAN